MYLKRLFLGIIVVGHAAVILGNIVAIFILPFREVWYVALPIITLLINLMFGATDCPLTRLENRVRRRLGMKEIKYFVGHYLIWPLKRYFKNSKAARK
jgi:hypothetical protein